MDKLYSILGQAEAREYFTEKDEKDIKNEFEKLSKEIKIKYFDLTSVKSIYSAFWYNLTDEGFIELSYKNNVVGIKPEGDIEIYQTDKSLKEIKKKYGKDSEEMLDFKFHGGKSEGILTPELYKYGRWENNNWFEIYNNKDIKVGSIFEGYPAYEDLTYT
ncbi:MAG: hypothetical protein QW478_12320, partial [Candidatus Micrarchaeaceae archaeon]